MDTLEKTLITLKHMREMIHNAIKYYNPPMVAGTTLFNKPPGDKLQRLFAAYNATCNAIDEVKILIKERATTNELVYKH